MLSHKHNFSSSVLTHVGVQFVFCAFGACVPFAFLEVPWLEVPWHFANRTRVLSNLSKFDWWKTFQMFTYVFSNVLPSVWPCRCSGCHASGDMHTARGMNVYIFFYYGNILNILTYEHIKKHFRTYQMFLCIQIKHFNQSPNSTSAEVPRPEFKNHVTPNQEHRSRHETPETV